MMKAGKIDRLLQIAIGALLLFLIYVIFDSVHQTVIAVGDSAPDFSIRADNGRTISRSDFGGKLLVLNFWATWCQPCVEEIPSLDEFQRRFRSSGVVVLGVSIDRDEKLYRRFLDRLGVSFATARDPENRINAEYGTFKVPETYIIDTSGRVVQKIVGSADWSDERMTQYVRSLL